MPLSFAAVTTVFLVLPLLAIFLINLVNRERGGKISIQAGYVVTFAQMAAAIICFILILPSQGADFINFAVFGDIGTVEGAYYFTVDFFSSIVLFAIGMVAFISLLVAQKTIGEKALNFVNLLMVIMIGMNGIAVATDLFTLYVFLEITGIASFILIALFKDKNGLEGAFKYLVMSAIASVFLLVSMAFIFMQAGSLKFEAIAALWQNWQGAEQPIFLLIASICLLVAFCIKAAVAPFHGWLPDAYQSAPNSVSVLLGGIVTKAAGVYALIRLCRDVFAAMPVMSTVLLCFATFSILYGAIAAVRQNDFKRILGYSSISQIGYIVLGVACGSPIGFIGALLHFFNHATFKTTLFVNAAAVEQETGTMNIEELGGLQSRMPVTGVSSILAFLSTAGVPPLAGFWSKLLIIIAVWQRGNVFIAGLALFASIFTAAYFLRLQRKVFFGPKEEKLAEVKEASGHFKFAEIVLSVITVGFGFIFPVVLIFLQAQGLL